MSGRKLLRRLSSAKQACAARAVQQDRRVLDEQPGSLAQPDDRLRVLLVKLSDPLFARFAHMRRSRNRVLVMRVDVEPHEIQRRKGWRLDDGHVVRGADGRAGDVRAGARANVRHTGRHAPANRIDELVAPKGIEETERVPSALLGA